MILLVEDDVITRAHFAATLRSYGYDVMETGDGVEALEILGRYRCELVITDMVLPNLNGIRLISHIEVKWPKTPVIMVSGYLAEVGGKNIFGDKVNCLEKPISPSGLVASVQRLVPRSIH